MNRLISFLVVALLSGCDSLSYRQFVIRDPSSDDERVLATAMATAASEAGLEEKTTESRAPMTVAYYSEPVPHFPVELGARFTGGAIVVDLTCFHPGPPSKAPSVFRVVDRVLSNELLKAFGDRLLVDPEPRIPFSHREPNQPLQTTPVSAPR